MMEGTGRILIIEDDPDIADVLRMNLQDQGFETDRAADGAEGLEKASGGTYSLIILDLILPAVDGLTVCTRIRERDRKTPILMLTARSEEIDRVLGLELGADDYVVKPFSVRELSARIRALLRRVRTDRPEPGAGADGERITAGELSIDFAKRKVLLAGRELELTAKEFDLLALFAKNPGRVYGRNDLLNLVWGYGFGGYEHTVNSHINRLRSKIETDPGNPRYILTVWGIGYRFAEHPGAEGPGAQR